MTPIEYSAMAHLASGVFFGCDPRRSYMAVYWNSYFDTSGMEKDKSILVCVGVIATAEKWIKFDRRWNAVLKEFGVKELHMKAFAHFEGEYADWRGKNERREAFLSRLLKEAKRGLNMVFVQGIVLPDYREVNKAFCLTEKIGGPYSLGQATCQLRTLDWLRRTKRGHHRVEFFVEHGDTGQPAFMNFLKDSGWPRPTLLQKHNSAGEAYTPFQVADLIAYEHRRLYERVVADRRLPHTSTWRGSLRALRRLLPFKAGIHDKASMIKACQTGKIPERKAP